MDDNLIDHLYYIFTYKYGKNTREKVEFSFYFNEILKNSHFFTKILIVFCSIFLNLASLFLNLKMFKNLSIKKTEKLIAITSKLSPALNFYKVVKIYSYIYFFEKYK